MDWACAAFDVDATRAEAALRGAAALGFGGLSITMPLKDVTARVCDVVHPAAAHLGAVNCVVVRPEGTLEGHNTDGAGFIDSLRVDHGVDVVEATVVVLGAGGAARAVVAAVAQSGAADVVVVNRTPGRSLIASELAGPAGRVGSFDDISAAAIVVNATSVGMGGTGDLPCDPALLHPGQVVIDLVYHPVETAWLVAAQSAGATTVDGVGMLVHQAAHAFRLWTGVDAPVDVMRAAARARLG